ncbi:hypothetical protein MRB53_038636 [Persea americana]|nr:hypothetical protein MRB53_038636 [Persea americana]
MRDSAFVPASITATLHLLAYRNALCSKEALFSRSAECHDDGGVDMSQFREFGFCLREFDTTNEYVERVKSHHSIGLTFCIQEPSRQSGSKDLISRQPFSIDLSEDAMTLTTKRCSGFALSSNRIRAWRSVTSATSVSLSRNRHRPRDASAYECGGLRKWLPLFGPRNWDPRRCMHRPSRWVGALGGRTSKVYFATIVFALRQFQIDELFSSIRTRRYSDHPSRVQDFHD